MNEGDGGTAAHNQNLRLLFHHTTPLSILRTVQGTHGLVTKVKDTRTTAHIHMTVQWYTWPLNECEGRAPQNSTGYYMTGYMVQGTVPVNIGGGQRPPQIHRSVQGTRYQYQGTRYQYTGQYRVPDTR